MTTVKKTIKITGVGIHSGAPVTMIMNPSDSPGIFFYRSDLGGDLIPATYDNVFSANMNTTIGRGEHRVQTIEHFMAALFMVGIDSAIIEIDGPEVPILDGSAAQFYELLKAKVESRKAKGIKKIIVKKEVIAYRKELIKKMPVFKRVMLWLHNLKQGRCEDGYVKLSPNAEGLLIRATLDYPDKIIGRQSYEYLFDGTKKSVVQFVRDIAMCRTFGKISEWEYLKKRGKGRGATEKNVIALSADGTSTINKLHCADEFARHKIVDAIGDMFTSGGMICGTLESVKGSHGLNNLVLRKLFSSPENYDIIE